MPRNRKNYLQKSGAPVVPEMTLFKFYELSIKKHQDSRISTRRW